MAQVAVAGPQVDNNTRCVHYHGLLDVIAIRFKCCDTYYPCYQCHSGDSSHSLIRWNSQDLFEASEKVILCGVCRSELTFTEYSGSHSSCIKCQARFNPKCLLHYHLYFEMDPETALCPVPRF